MHELTEAGIGLKVLTGQGAAIDTTTPAGQLVFAIFAALAEYERSLISERTIAGLSAARARGRTGGRPYTMTPAKIRLAAAAMTDRTPPPRRCAPSSASAARPSTATSPPPASSDPTR